MDDSELSAFVLLAINVFYGWTAPAKKTNNRSPIETITEIPMVSIKIPLAFSSKTITKFFFVVCFGHFPNKI